MPAVETSNAAHMARTPALPSLVFPRSSVDVTDPSSFRIGGGERLAPGEHPAPGEPPAPRESLGFADLVDMINPLHHLPIIGTLYREASGDEIGPLARIIGGTLFGGLIGLVFSIFDVAVEKNTGQDIGEHIMSGFSADEPDAEHPPQRQGRVTIEELPPRAAAPKAPLITPAETSGPANPPAGPGAGLLPGPLLPGAAPAASPSAPGAGLLPGPLVSAGLLSGVIGTALAASPAVFSGAKTPLTSSTPRLSPEAFGVLVQAMATETATGMKKSEREREAHEAAGLRQLQRVPKGSQPGQPGSELLSVAGAAIGVRI